MPRSTLTNSHVVPVEHRRHAARGVGHHQQPLERRDSSPATSGCLQPRPDASPGPGSSKSPVDPAPVERVAVGDLVAAPASPRTRPRGRSSGGGGGGSGVATSGVSLGPHPPGGRAHQRPDRPRSASPRSARPAGRRAASRADTSSGATGTGPRMSNDSRVVWPAAMPLACLDRAREQRRRRSGVLVVRVPGPARQLGRHEAPVAGRLVEGGGGVTAPTDHSGAGTPSSAVQGPGRDARAAPRRRSG